MFNFILEHLHNLCLKNHVTIRQLMLGQNVSRTVKVKYIVNSQRIQVAQAQLNLSTITIHEFLIKCSHTAENYISQELNWMTVVQQHNADEDESKYNKLL